MRSLLPVLSLILIFTIIFASCKKDHPNQPTGTVVDSSDTVTVHLNYIYLATNMQIQQYGVTQFELILSSGSNILLDTIAPVNTPLITAIKTPSPLVNMSVITYRTNTAAYAVTTEMAISPGAWSVLPGSDSTIGVPIYPYNNSQVNINYTHVPVPPGSPFHFSGSIIAFQQGLVSGLSNNQLDLSFSDYPYLEAWLCFPDQGLYNYHRMSGSLADTVDLSAMDTAISISITHPAGFTNTQTLVYGFPDSTNPQREISVSASGPEFGTITGADLVYPGYNKVFQKYNFSYLATDSSGDEITYGDVWADSITPTPFLVDNTFFNILSNANNNFSIQFPKQVPGYYSLAYNGTKLGLIINMPGDSTTVQPVNFLTALNSKMLKNSALTSIQPSFLGFKYKIIQGQPQPLYLAPLTDQYLKPADLPTASYTKVF